MNRIFKYYLDELGQRVFGTGTGTGTTCTTYF